MIKNKMLNNTIYIWAVSQSGYKLEIVSSEPTHDENNAKLAALGICVYASVVGVATNLISK